MEKPKVTGIQHVGIGVRDIEKSRSFYKNVLSCTLSMADFGIMHNAMPDFFRTSPHVFKGCMVMQAQDSIVVECIQRLEPTPRPIHGRIRYGDIGVNKVTVETGNVEKWVQSNKDRINFVSPIQKTTLPGLGDYAFVYGTDPDGNLIEFVSGSNMPVEGDVGRIRSLGISVTDLDRSVAFYRQYLDFDRMVIEPHEQFSGLVGEVSGNGQTRVRSCLLGNGNGFHMLELYEVSNPRGRSIPFHVLWGDYGYLEGCCVCDDILGLTKFFMTQGLEFVSHPTAMEVHEEGISGTAWFIYVRDPDGVPVEVLELPA